MERDLPVNNMVTQDGISSEEFNVFQDDRKKQRGLKKINKDSNKQFMDLNNNNIKNSGLQDPLSLKTNAENMNKMITPMNQIDHNSHNNNKNTNKGHLILSDHNMSHSVDLNGSVTKYDSNKKNKQSTPCNQKSESHSKTSSESLSLSNLSKPLKIHQYTNKRQYLNVQTFKLKREGCLEPERMLTIKEKDNYPALDQFLNAVWCWCNGYNLHKQCNHLKKLVLWMPEQLHSDDWFCKRCQQQNV